MRTDKEYTRSIYIPGIYIYILYDVTVIIVMYQRVGLLYLVPTAQTKPCNNTPPPV